MRSTNNRKRHVLDAIRITARDVRAAAESARLRPCRPWFNVP
jgi:hypothetical protein